MFASLPHVLPPLGRALVASLFLQPLAQAATTIDTHGGAQSVDLVIALDVSSSMSGLIESAKQRLWDVVNELQRAQPQPDLRVAVLSYGSPRYGAQSGFVKLDVPLTRDLDAVNEALFGFETGGGSEYVARVIARASDGLDWSQQDKALRIIFVAGNESATQDPQLSVGTVAAAALQRGIVVNTIFCGTDSAQGIAQGWRRVADTAGGFYTSIDQGASAVAEVSTPYDATLRALNGRLNRTYVPYGAHGEARRSNQLRQDQNAASMSAPAAASRAVTKAGRAYRSSEWDLIDALKAGTRLESVEDDALPSEMRGMSQRQREAFVATKTKERAAINAEIQRLAKDRRAYIEKARRSAQEDSETGLADALTGALRSAAEKKGFRFN